MRALIVYDSLYGNTEKIAKAIGSTVGGEADVLRAAEVDPGDVKDLDLLIVGSPTHGGRPTEAIQGLLGRLEESLPAGTSVAAFDTRLAARWVAIFGYAAGRIARTLEESGGTLAASPQGFVVERRQGPPRGGELERAADWAREVVVAG
jgi:flavodoxin